MSSTPAGQFAHSQLPAQGLKLFVSSTAAEHTFLVFCHDQV